MQSLLEIVLLVVGVAKFLIFVHVIMSWLISFNVLNANQQLVGQIWYGLNRLLEPIYDPIRRILPQTGGLDLAPLVALLAIFGIEIIIRNNFALFA
ncbi:MAG: YggT family protein [Rhodobacteraceae bacterium]|nr:YggT family protein [Paracoccaceae bacterium]